MKSLYWLLSFALLGTVSLFAAAGLAQTSGGGQAPAGSPPTHLLTPFEESLVRSPFPGPDASFRLKQNLMAREQHRRQIESLPESQRPGTPDNGGMGWAVSDAEYWRQIPVEARAIPLDWSRLPAVRFTNTQLGGTREICLAVQKEYDLWLLRDPLHELTACISVHRATRRAYFMEIGLQANGTWTPRRAKDHCYSCHPSGPRILRPLAEPGLDHQRLEQFNRRILGYGACDLGDSVDRKTRGKPYADTRCIGCHNGVDRGKLYAIHRRPIQFKTEMEGTMPPQE